MVNYSDPAWPPGTVRLELLKKDNSKDTDIILQPRPTENPNDPLNWPKWTKILNYFLASFYAMMVFANINATSPTWGPMGDELGFDTATLTDTYAIGCATLAIGAPMLIPFALKFGRRPVYVISSLGQFAVMIWAAETQTAGDWWGVNAVQCWLGALAEVMVQMTVADVFFVHQRGLMNAIYLWVTNIGSYLAVVAAGFIAQDLGWRWVWWIVAIIFGCQLVAMTLLYEETKFNHLESIEGRQGSVVVGGTEQLPPSFNEKEPTKDATNADAESGSEEEFARRLTVTHINRAIPRKTWLQKLSLATSSPGPWLHFLRHSWQPFMILVSVPGVLYMTFVYGLLQAWSTVQTTALSTYMLEPPYNFTAAEIGMMNLGPFIGGTLGSIVCGPFSDWLILRLARRNGGIYEPEMRLWAFLPFIPFAIAGPFWFGYSLDEGKSWSSIVVAFGMSNFGASPILSIALTYMTDAYSEIIGDALTGVTFVRNLVSTIFVFALTPWVSSVGMNNVFNTIGAIAIVTLLFSLVVIWQGKKWRVSTVHIYQYYADRQFDARPLGE